MIRLLIGVFSVLVLLSGCMSPYYYKVKNNNIHIYLMKPDAEEVFFLCSIDRFERHEALKNARGIWETTIPSDQGFSYFFIVDGKVFIPPCDQKEKDDFGSENCVYVPGQ